MSKDVKNRQEEKRKRKYKLCILTIPSAFIIYLVLTAGFNPGIERISEPVHDFGPVQTIAEVPKLMTVAPELPASGISGEGTEDDISDIIERETTAETEEFEELAEVQAELETQPETEESLGVFKVTVYCPSSDNGQWGYKTATGVRSRHLETCAVDPKVIPLGTNIEIGDLELVAVDTGSSVKGNIVDIFYDGTYDEALRWISDFGTKHEVRIIEE